MQTTLRLRDDLYRRAKAQAAERGTSLTRFIEEAIQRRLETPQPARRKSRRVVLPISTAKGGLGHGFSSLEQAIAAANLEEDRRRAGT